MLCARGICMSYGRQKILENVDIDLSPGECVGIVGVNGCGKTTLLSILAGSRKGKKGSILVDGKPFFKDHPVAYVPQENPLVEELSVRDNLLLWYKGDRKKMEKDLVDGPAAILGIPQMLKKTAGQLSGGMKKRLSIACSLALGSRYLIMDEPGAALDLECKEMIRRYLKDYVREGGAVLLTSHEMEELAVCSKLYVLSQRNLKEVPLGLTAEELIKTFRDQQYSKMSAVRPPLKFGCNWRKIDRKDKYRKDSGSTSGTKDSGKILKTM